MYAAKAAAGGAAPGQVQGQQGVPSSGQGMYSYDTNLDDEDSVTITINFDKSFNCFKGLHVCVKINNKAFIAFYYGKMISHNCCTGIPFFSDQFQYLL